MEEMCEHVNDIDIRTDVMELPVQWLLEVRFPSYTTPIRKPI
jgi:hypothetical protein